MPAVDSQVMDKGAAPMIIRWMLQPGMLMSARARGCSIQSHSGADKLSEAVIARMSIAGCRQDADVY